jgi:hypothetical protein
MQTQQKQVLHKITYMQIEGDELAAWLNRNPKSRLARHFTFFSMSRNIVKAGQYPAMSQADAKSVLFGARRATRKRTLPGKPFNPAKAYNIKARLHFLIQPDGTYNLRLLPVGNTDSALLLVLQLSGARQLHRLIQCVKCGRWLFARIGLQKFCSPSCQRNYFRSSESWKEKRKLYMRQYRAQERERNTLGMLQAKKARREGER